MQDLAKMFARDGHVLVRGIASRDQVADVDLRFAVCAPQRKPGAR